MLELAYINEDGIIVDPLGKIVERAKKDAQEILEKGHAGGFICDRRKNILKQSYNDETGKELYELYCELLDEQVTSARGLKKGTYAAAYFSSWEAKPEKLLI